MALEAKDLEFLSYPFQAKSHKFIQGKPYLHEEPITERLDSIDPSWQWKLTTITTRNNAGAGGSDMGTAVAYGTLTIKGVSRDGVGMAVIQKTKSGTSEANEAEKSAATDAFKRAFRMFGGGRYLLTIPKDDNGQLKVQNVQQLAQWLKATYGDIKEAPVYHDDTPDINDVDSFLNPEGKPVIADRILTIAKGLTIGLYNNVRQHQDNSVNLLIENGHIDGTMNSNEIAAVIFLHRASEDLGIDEKAVTALLKKHPVDLIQKTDAFNAAFKKLIDSKK